MNKYFGTDGIRGVVGKSLMTPDFLVKLGLAAGIVLKKTNPKARVVIGMDTRRSGPMIQSALEAGLSAMGVDIYLLGIMPTPGVAYLTRAFHADAGIVISASHNLHQDNGIKFFGNNGAKLSDEMEFEIEQAIEKLMPHNLVLNSSFEGFVTPNEIGVVREVNDAAGRYIEFCKATAPYFFSLSNFKIVLDCAHGATYHIAPKVFHELGAEVELIGVAPDGLNINLGVGSTDTKLLQKKVVEMGADLGIALDGDGDRVILVDHEGQRVDGDQIVYLLAQDCQEAGVLKTGVVGTHMSNFGLQKALEKLNIPFVRTSVGDRHVMMELKKRQWLLGGESSGHIIWLDSTTTGDGIVAALQVLSVIKKRQKSLKECLCGMTKYPQVLINLKTNKKLSVEEIDKAKTIGNTAASKMLGSGRVLIRPSGTEPLLRVMVEGENLIEVNSLAEYLAKEITRVCFLD